MEPKRLTIALPKGKLFTPCIRLLRRVGLPWEGLLEDTRQLVFDYETIEPSGHVTRYIVCRPTDIPTFVEYGAADLGIVGKDTIVEDNKNVFELVDLKFGYCRFVVAVPESMVESGNLPNFSQARVATKFPRVAEAFFREKGIQVEIVKLHGNIELAPRVGLSDVIVDIVSTGRTLKDNQLVAVEEIFPATARLIANRASFRIKAEIIQPLQEKMREVAEKEDLEADEDINQS
ncbi:MAG: ATP phosphoribosyltransferase [Syntrophomonadaceae bacterium]|nr:ATP phosphoribosyltransferase [Syntrophomonadaceae bacterium]